MKKKIKFFLIFTFLSFLSISYFLIFLQIIIGAFVSGLDAGKFIKHGLLGNTFPNDLEVAQIDDLVNFENHPSTILSS